MTSSSRLRRQSVAIVLAAAGIVSSVALLDAASDDTPARTPERDEVELILSGLGLLGGGTAALLLRRRM